MATLKRKVSFYKLSLEKSTIIKETNTVKIEQLPTEELIDYFEKIYNQKATKLSNDNRAITVETSSGNYVIEIVEFNKLNSFIKIGRQNPADTVALRDIETLETELVPMSESQLLELYTYCLIDFETGIVSYIGINGAPKISAIRSLFYNCFYADENVEAKLAAIMTNDILQTLIHKKIISKLTLTVAVPDDKILSDTIGLDENSFDALQNIKTRTASYKLVASRNKNIFASSGRLAEAVASIKGKFGDKLIGLSANAKNQGESSQVYDLLHYNFTKTVILDSKEEGFFTEEIFKNSLLETYNKYKSELIRYSRI